MRGWIICLVIIVALLILMWLFIGGGEYEFEGLRGLLPPPPEEVCHIEKVPSPVRTAPVKITPPDVKVVPAPRVDNKPVDITPEIPLVLEPGDEFRADDGRKFASKGEAICCLTLEKIYNKPFIKVRPNWLKNPETGRNLELDGYNEELGIAFEYNGIQHYVWPNFTGMTREQFINQARRDTFKLDLCDKLGIYLITIPYNVPHSYIPSYIEYYLPEKVKRRRELTS
jgi:hypothetical protein